MGLLSGKQIGLITIFTIVELVTLTLWLILLGVSITGNMILAAGVLFIGLLVEHAIAIIAGDFPAKGAVRPQNGN